MIKNKQILINLITNLLAMGFSMLISLWITPYLLNKLGLSAYGYIGIVSNIINFIAIITYTLTSMVGRFLTFSLNKDGPQLASQYMSSALFTGIFISISLLPFFILLCKYLDHILIIESNFQRDVQIAFLLEGFTFVFTTISLIFSAGAYCKNRLEIINVINILSNILRAIVLISVFTIFTASIWLYSLSTLIQVFAALILGIISFRLLLPEIIFKLRLFRLKLSWELLSSGFFTSIIILGNLFTTQIDLLVGNHYLASETVGIYAAMLLIPNSLRNIGAALSFAFSPTTVKLYSIGNIAELRDYTNKAVKICGLLIGWPTAIISGLCVPILNLWLNKDFSSYQFLLVLMLLPLVLILGVNQLFIVQQAMNKVKIPAISSIIFGLLNILLSILFVGKFKMGLPGIVLSSITMSLFRAFIFNPLYTAYITNQKIFTYYRGVISPFLITSLTCVVGIFIQKYILINSLILLFSCVIVLSLFYFGVSIFATNREDRTAIYNIALSIVRKPKVKLIPIK